VRTIREKKLTFLAVSAICFVCSFEGNAQRKIQKRQWEKSVAIQKRKI
jgi:hypothetical protein